MAQRRDERMQNTKTICTLACGRENGSPSSVVTFFSTAVANFVNRHISKFPCYYPCSASYPCFLFFSPTAVLFIVIYLRSYELIKCLINWFHIQHTFTWPWAKCTRSQFGSLRGCAFRIPQILETMTLMNIFLFSPNKWNSISDLSYLSSNRKI